MMNNCFRNVHNIRKNVYGIIISPIYYTIKAAKQLQWIHLSFSGEEINNNHNDLLTASLSDY